MNNNSGIEEKFLSDKKIIDHTTDAVNRAAGRTGLSESAPPAQKISSYLSYLDSVISRGFDNTRKTYQNDIKLLRNMFYERFIIRPENILESYFEHQKQIALENGHGYLEYDQQTKEKEKNGIINQQRSTLDIWLDFFASKEAEKYPMWFKYYAFHGMTKIGKFDYGEEKISKRTANTTHPFVELDEDALYMVYKNLLSHLNKQEIDVPELKKILEGGNFGKLYTAALKKLKNIDMENAEGIWVKYDQGSDPKILFEHLYGKNHDWCTGKSLQTAKTHLEGGDFYVYYTKGRDGHFTEPRIAIRKEDGRIAEIRGIAKGQELEETMVSVVEEKLKEAAFPDRDIYKQKFENMKRLTKIHNKWKEGAPLEIEDLRYIYELDGQIIGFGYEKDPRIAEITNSRNAVADLKMLTGYSSKEVTGKHGSYDGTVVKIHYGDIKIKGEKLRNFKFPEHVIGNIYLEDVVIIENVEFPVNLSGKIHMPRINKMENVQFTFGVEDSLELETLESIKHVSFNGDMESLDLSGVFTYDDVTFPNTVRTLYFGGTLDGEQKINLPKGLTYMDISLLHPESFTFPDTLNTLHVVVQDASLLNVPMSLRVLNLRATEAKGLALPESLAHLTMHVANADGLELDLPTGLRSISWTELQDINVIKNFDNLQKLETLELGITSVENLTLPNSIRILTLPCVKKVENLTINPNLKELYLNSQEINGLILPENIECLSLGAKTVDDLVLPKKMRRLSLPNLQTAEGICLPEEVESLNLEGLETFDGLTLPKVIKGDLRIPFLEDVSGLKIPESEDERERIIEAIVNTYSQAPEAMKFVKKIEKHFAKEEPKVVKKDTKETPSPTKTIMQGIPKTIKVTSQFFSDIKGKTKRTSSLVMEKFLLLKQKYNIVQNTKMYNNDDNKIADETEKTTDETRKK